MAAEHSHTSTSRLSYLRCERVVAEPREQPTFLCRAASPALWREPAARGARVRRVPPAPCSERWVLSRRKLRCAPVLHFRANDLLFSAEFGLGMSLDVTKSSKNITKKYKQPLLSP